MTKKRTIAIIGSGPSAIYLLKHVLAQADSFKRFFASFSIYERGKTMGMGMPYSPEMSDVYNMGNIPSREMAALLTSFADWLETLDAATLAALKIEKEKISDRKIYSRVALGQYLQQQYREIISELTKKGLAIREFPNCAVTDVTDNAQKRLTTLTIKVSGRKEEHDYDKVIIATGHHWPHEDRPELGYFSSPWPISKLLPKEGEYFNFTIGTLGASLSAFDVITSLAHRQGDFVRTEEGYDYHPASGTEKFKVVMGAGHGRLPHLRYDIEEIERKIYQHVSRNDLLALIDDEGFLRLNAYFDAVCRPALRKAFIKDGLDEIATLLANQSFTLTKFIERMTNEHSYTDAFEGMRREMVEARKSVLEHRPIHWKEMIDDVIYTLNFHAELLPAEDHLVLHSVVMPFLMNVIAAMPLHSADKLLALHAAGKLEMLTGRMKLSDQQAQPGRTTIEWESDSGKEALSYRMFVDCSGQKPVEIADYPFPSLVKEGLVRRARAAFVDDRHADDLPPEKAPDVFCEDGKKFYHTSGIDVDGTYRIIANDGKASERIYDIAFPHTMGVRPYSYGLQSCSDTGDIVAQALIAEAKNGETSEAVSTKTVTKIYEKV